MLRLLAASSASPAVRLGHRAFHASARLSIPKIGDSLPDVPLFEASPANKVNLAQELTGKGVIVGVPAAYSPACSASHIPGYIKSPKLKDAGTVVVVSVNDPFVMKAWGSSLDPDGKSGIRFLADTHGAFTNALDLSFDSKKIFGNDRSKRYALVVENGKVKAVHIEPDNTGVNVSAAEKVLG
ncbi:AhpC/TSA family protein [Phyllosticta citricarpa]|uniref:AhpC/TSA family protein n=2 Tax=Phyllosticta TaxID=121621 RepID=A0ABR1ML26_9PEZI